ncbi:MAG: 4-hydroxy-tetrahydrodipicolinate reductase [Pseudomonadota bacterium]
MAVKVAIGGATGRMGSTLIELAQIDKDVELSLITDVKDNLHDKQLQGLGIPFTDDLTKHFDIFDVFIDFTRPEGTMRALDACVLGGKSLVIGTTGFSSDEHENIKKAGNEISIVCSPNMSVGVNLLYVLIDETVHNLQKINNIKVIDKHHKHKVDAPSGTALKIEEVLRHSLKKAHNNDVEITVDSIREGEDVGQHIIDFNAQDEKITLTHEASSRHAFARGAILAAKWLATKDTNDKGIFTISDVLSDT